MDSYGDESERTSVRAHRLLVMLSAAIAIAVLSAPFASAVERRAQPESNQWLTVVNYYRRTAHLPPVRHDKDLSEAARKHARYMVRNDAIGHSESPKDPLYSVAGAEAASHSNVAGWWGGSPSNRDFVEMWMTGPFHAVGILRPNLEKVGYGVASDDKGLTTAAALDVLHGLDYTARPKVSYPIVWPGNGTTQPLASYTGGEYPDPLASCNGYEEPSGLPIIVQFAEPTRNVKASVSHRGDKLPACKVHATSYRNRDASAQALGRALLAGDNVVLVIPKKPLDPGSTYLVKVTSGGKTARSRFSISP